MKLKIAFGLLLIVILLFIMHGMLIPGSKASNTVIAVKADSPTPTVSVTSTALTSVWCERPYAASSLWNKPIDWSIAKIHPKSQEMIQTFFATLPWVGSDPTQYAPNVYLVNNKTPLVAVELWKNRSFRDAIDDVNIRYGEPGGTVLVPLPTDAQPAPGTDGELAIVNLESGEEWGLINGQVDDSGHWTAGGVYRYYIKNSGIPPKGFAQRGAGIGSLAGIVRPCEIERGYIHHAVTLAYDYPCAPNICQGNGWPQVIPPFTKTDGKGLSKYDIPEGARLAIRPDISLEKIVDACADVKGCILWVVNMQEYGGFIVDDSGHPKTYAEGDATAHWNPSVWTSDMLQHIPTEWYVVIDWNYPSTQ